MNLLAGDPNALKRKLIIRKRFQKVFLMFRICRKFQAILDDIKIYGTSNHLIDFETKPIS